MLPRLSNGHHSRRGRAWATSVGKLNWTSGTDLSRKSPHCIFWSTLYLFGHLLISLSHFLSDYLGLFCGECRFCPRHTDRFFSGFLETRISPPPNTCLYEGRMQKNLWQQHNKNVSGVKNARAEFEFHLFVAIANVLHMHPQAHPLLCLAERPVLGVNRGSRSI